MKTYIILAAAIFSQAMGNVFLSKGMKQVALADRIADGHLLTTLLQVIQSPMIWIGTALMTICFVLFLTALSKADLSFVLPVISIEVIVNVAFAFYFLKEPVSATRWIGTLLISAGVILVFKSERKAVRERNGSPELEET